MAFRTAGGVAVAFRRELAEAENPEARRLELEEQLAEGTRPNARAESFSMHELIDPRETRARLCEWVEWIQPILPSLVGPVNFPVRP